MVELLAAGEILVDMIPEQVGEYSKVLSFRKCFGGAPFNTAIGAARLGAKVGALCAVGEDQFGKFLLDTLKANGIDISGVVVKHARTSLAFVLRREGGERDFFFYRKPWAETADTMLSPSDLRPSTFSGVRIFHYSGVALSHEPCRGAMGKAVELARQAGAMVAFDPNIREDLWENPEELRRVYHEAMKKADILLLAREEAEWLFGTSEPEKVEKAASKYRPKYLCLKLGGEGCYVVSGRERARIPAFRVKVRDTTGAGDAWAAGFEVGLLRGLPLEGCATLASAVAALCVTEVGAITALPTLEKVRRFLKHLKIELNLKRAST
ncbi:MAG: carbohydrate kinase [Candidatus Hadarchaeales archaeon]